MPAIEIAQNRNVPTPRLYTLWRIVDRRQHDRVAPRWFWRWLARRLDRHYAAALSVTSRY